MKGFYCLFGDRYSLTNNVGTLLWNDPFLWMEGYQKSELVSWDEGMNRGLVFGDVQSTSDEYREVYKEYKKKRIFGLLCRKTKLFISSH